MNVNLKIIYSSLLLLSIYVGLLQANNSNNDSDKLEVKVYYEALCIDSMRFFTRKLYPSMMTKNRFPFTKLQLVPYGKVSKSQNGKTNETQLSCQHGSEECELNALHACIIENNSPMEALDVINCLMNGFNTNIDLCADRYSVDVSKAKKCSKQRSVAEILEKYGQETSKIDISFVPSIGMDNIINYDDQYQLRQNFDSVFCRKYLNKFNHTLEGCTRSAIAQPKWHYVR